MTVQAYKPAGPTIERFHKSFAKTRGVMGPIGGGKTTAMAQDIKLKSAMVPPVMVGGYPVRHVRWGAFRRTYRQIEQTTLPSWFASGIPKDAPSSTFRGGSGGEPGVQETLLQLTDGTLMQLQMIFLAVDDFNVEEVLRGWELTGAWGNEADTLPEEWFRKINGRLRYPLGELAGPTGESPFYGSIMDFNAPDEDNYLFDEIMDPSKGTEFFIQPGGLDPKAENLQNLPGGRRYYLNEVEKNKKRGEWYIRRFIHNQFGYSRDGKPVFPEFNDNRHVASSELDWEPDLPLIIGVDAGRTPAAAIVQLRPGGQLQILGEFVFEGTARPFARALREYLQREFPGCEVEIYRDPATDNPNDVTDGDWGEIFDDEFFEGLDRSTPSPCKNVLATRLEAVTDQLLGTVEKEPAAPPKLLLCPSCKVIRRAFNSGYRYKRMKVAGGRWADKPDKNEYSHPMDALQYAIVGAVGVYRVLARQARSGMLGHNGGPSMVEYDDYEPLSL